MGTCSWTLGAFIYNANGVSLIRPVESCSTLMMMMLCSFFRHALPCSWLGRCPLKCNTSLEQWSNYGRMPLLMTAVTLTGHNRELNLGSPWCESNVLTTDHGRSLCSALISGNVL